MRYPFVAELVLQLLGSVLNALKLIIFKAI